MNRPVLLLGLQHFPFGFMYSTTPWDLPVIGVIQAVTKVRLDEHKAVQDYSNDEHRRNIALHLNGSSCQPLTS